MQRRTLFRLHNATGLAAALVLVLSALTGGMLVFRGLCLYILEGQSVGPFPPSFQQLSTGFVPDFLIPPLGEIFADIDPQTQNVTAETIEAALTPKTRAVIVVHLAGLPCDMDPILELAARRGLFSAWEVRQRRAQRPCLCPKDPCQHR